MGQVDILIKEQKAVVEEQAYSLDLKSSGLIVHAGSNPAYRTNVSKRVQIPPRLPCGRVVELADACDSKSHVLRDVRVQVPPRPPI